MKIFIDSANIKEIKQAYELGIIDGITTNPSLIKKAVDNFKLEGKEIDMKRYIQEILIIAKGTPVSLEITEVNYERMINQANRLISLYHDFKNDIVIKIPINTSLDNQPNTDAIKAIKTLSSKGIKINCTLIFTPEQALLAAKAGATYVSPFAGRIDDLIRSKLGMKKGEDFQKTDYFPEMGLMDEEVKLMDDNGIVSGVDLVSQCVEILKNYKTEVIAASIRNQKQTRECALVGADIATLPFSVIKQLLIHKKTTEGMNAFMKDVVDKYKKLLE